MPNRTVTCGDCIHADICKQVNGGWFSRENIAYCKAFKDRTNYVEVVRCKDCWKSADWLCSYHFKNVPGKDFCGDGERKDDENP